MGKDARKNNSLNADRSGMHGRKADDRRLFLNIEKTGSSLKLPVFVSEGYILIMKYFSAKGKSHISVTQRGKKFMKKCSS